MKTRLLSAWAALAGLLLVARTDRMSRTAGSPASQIAPKAQRAAHTVADSALCSHGETLPPPTRDPSAQEIGVRELPYFADDTMFLYNQTWNRTDETEHIKAYVVRNRIAEQFKEVYEATSFDEKMDRSVELSLPDLKAKYPGPLPVHDLADLPQAWVLLSRLHGKYYVDLLDLYPLWIADSLLIRSTMEAIERTRIRLFEPLSRTHYLLSADFDYSEQPVCVDIHIVDPVRLIALFRFRGLPEFDLLYGAAARIDQFDLVAWDLTGLPQGDAIQGDVIDYEAMIPDNGARYRI